MKTAMAFVRSVLFVSVAHFARTSSGFQAAHRRATSVEHVGAKGNEVVCLGSMCGRPGVESFREVGTDTVFDSIEVDYKLMGRHPFCEANRLSESRLVLLPMAAGGHGITALASVLMSSSEISTLCSADTPQCDGEGILKTMGASGQNDWLRRFSHHWNLKRHVFLAPHPDHKREVSAFEEELQHGLPEPMSQAGIKRVFLLNLIMWRPVCMGVLSGSASKEPLDYARHELQLMEQLVAAHRHSMRANQPTLVMSLADLLWNPSWSKSRMEKMIPCMGKLDFDAIPELYYDYHPKNGFRLDASVLQFGRANPASQSGYDLAQRSCGAEHNVFLHLPHDEQMRAQAAVEYLDSWSQ